MNKSDPPQMEPKEVKSSDDTPTSFHEKQQHKKIRTSPPVGGGEDSPKLLDKHPSPTTSSPPATTSPTSTSPRANTNSNNPHSDNNINPRHDKDTTEESLYHKRANKQGKHKNKKDNQPLSWGTRLRTHPKPVVRFGSNNSNSPGKGKDGSDEEPDDSQDLPHERDPSPPSSPHPSDDVPLETLLKHGSGWVRN